MTLNFKEFDNKSNLQNEATSSLEIREVLNKLGLESNTYLRDRKIITKGGIVNLHHNRVLIGAAFMNENSLDSNGCPPPKSLVHFILRKYRKCYFF